MELVISNCYVTEFLVNSFLCLILFNIYFMFYFLMLCLCKAFVSVFDMNFIKADALSYLEEQVC